MEESRAFEAVLCDRDGTLVRDVAYNGDPALVEPLAAVAAGLDRLRAAGLRLAVVSNQSGVARGLLTTPQVEAVNARLGELLGPFDAVVWCLVVGDIGADVAAARAAGAASVLVPTPVTRPEEVADAPCVADNFRAAVDLLLPTAVARARPHAGDAS